MKILITGSSGFIGKHLTNYISKEYKNAEIYIASRSSNYTNLQLPNTKYLYLDINETDHSEVFSIYYDVIFHLAWSDIQNYNHENHINKQLPDQEKFLKKAWSHTNKLIIAGTCFEYGLREGCLKETDATKPVTSYGKAKDLLRKELFRFIDSPEKHLIWLRIFYVYGEGQSSKSLLPQLQQAIDNGDKQFNMSPGDQQRDYMHVNTLVKYMARFIDIDYNGVVNCSSNQPIVLKDFVRDYISKFNPDSDIRLNFGYYSYNPYEPKDFWGDNALLLKLVSAE